MSVQHEAPELRRMAIAQPIAPAEPSPSGLAAHRIRRCTFRRLIQVEIGRQRTTDVQCLYPDRRLPLPLGDLDSATPICNECTAAHIFRPDED
ncbi:MAG: hypothetical protein FJ038_13385 [Chloroflexi bacterium]|nr:hypothetical protein [Chloroflexota bacterium]